MAVATHHDVATALGVAEIPEGPERDQVEWWLTGVEMLIRKRFGDISTLDTETVRYVEAEAVAAKKGRVARINGESSVTVSVDDGSVTRRFENTPVSDDDITDDWWDLLTPDGATDAWTINPFPQRRRRSW